MVVKDAATGLGRDVDTYASSYVTLVYDDGEQSRAQKVIKRFLMLFLENCGTMELVKDGVAVTSLCVYVIIERSIAYQEILARAAASQSIAVRQSTSKLS